MMGRSSQDQGQLFYCFNLDDAVPIDHQVREIARVLDLSWVHAELAPYYSSMGRPSIDPVLIIRMLVVGYVFAVRSERALCREVQFNLAYRSAAAPRCRNARSRAAFTRQRATSPAIWPRFGPTSWPAACARKSRCCSRT